MNPGSRQKEPDPEGGSSEILRGLLRLSQLGPAAEPEHAGHERERGEEPAASAQETSGSGSGIDSGLRSGPESGLEERLKRLSEPTQPGQRFEREGQIARGGMAVIHRVRDVQLNRVLALKELVTAPGSDQVRAAARFFEEAQITAQLDHPGIVPIHEVGLDGEGRLYFAMKLVRGRDLLTILELAREGGEGWTQTRLLGVLHKVCEAMAYAHSKGVIHRDLKPANVMVGHFGEVYVMDWGLARVMGRQDVHDLRLQLGELSGSLHTERREEREDAPDSPLVTMDGTVVGTPAYMPPEQARGEVHLLSPRSDVYSIGAILYHLLTAQMPFVPSGTRPSKHTVLARVIDGPPRPVEQLNPLAPVELVAICAKAMAREPEQRYHDTLALAEDLRSYLEGRVVHAHETGALAELRKWVGRNKGLAASAAAAVLALLGGFVTSSSLYVRAAEKTALATSEKERADSEAANAKRRAEEVLRLSALQALDDLTADADSLWPVLPESVSALESWLVRADGLLQNLPEHERTLAELELSNHEDDRWWHDQLAKLIAELGALSDEETGLLSAGISPEHGWGMRRRLEFARTIDERSVSGSDASAKWAEALASIRDMDRCPWYRGLELVPQVGLVPCGQDPHSGLWEFVHLQTGEPPERGTDGRLILKDGTGLVLVLLPGGSFLMGAQRTDPAKPNYDPEGESDEWPEREVRLSPFFLSKYEMSQGQWQRLTGRNPSYSGPDDRMPVEQVSWIECEEVCRQAGLVLPSEAQWEYAARGGEDAPWWSGEDSTLLAEVANVADRAHRASGAAPADQITEDWDDFWDEPAPVGSYAANPFGLHNVHGNVWEWCLDWYRFSGPEGSVDPVRVEQGDSQFRVYRGGCFMRAASNARSANRDFATPVTAGGAFGCRPARRITP